MLFADCGIKNIRIHVITKYLLEKAAAPDKNDKDTNWSVKTKRTYTDLNEQYTAYVYYPVVSGEPKTTSWIYNVSTS